eukprot:scaffold12161_cov123-Isochrysis_galbana.AAC.1
MGRDWIRRAYFLWPSPRGRRCAMPTILVLCGWATACCMPTSCEQHSEGTRCAVPASGDVRTCAYMIGNRW